MTARHDRYASGVLGHDRPTELQRLRVRERVMDPETQRILAGLGLQPAWRSLELGAGTGSIARWLAERCPDGDVVATDLDLRHLGDAEAPNLEVRRHDVVHEDFPEASFDLIHARSLLVNIPERDVVLVKIVSWLAPGGWAVIEEPAMPLHASSPYPAFRRLFCAYEEALMASHGADVQWARRLPSLLHALGLRDVGLAVAPQLVGDGGPGEQIWRIALAQARERMLDLRLITDDEFAAGIALFDDPGFVEVAMLVVSAWARKPAG